MSVCFQPTPFIGDTFKKI